LIWGIWHPHYQKNMDKPFGAGTIKEFANLFLAGFVSTWIIDVKRKNQCHFL